MWVNVLEVVARGLPPPFHCGAHHASTNRTTFSWPAASEKSTATLVPAEASVAAGSVVPIAAQSASAQPRSLPRRTSSRADDSHRIAGLGRRDFHAAEIAAQLLALETICTGLLGRPAGEVEARSRRLAAQTTCCASAFRIPLPESSTRPMRRAGRNSTLAGRPARAPSVWYSMSTTG